MNSALFKVGLAPFDEAQRIHRELPHVIGSQPPYNVKAIAEHYGLAVDAYPFVSISGCLVDLGPGLGHAIGVNRRHSRERRRWTVAHELYHFLEHRGRLPALACSDNPDPKLITLEEEANVFAAELLMPEPWVRTWWSRTGSAKLCAPGFLVSVTAMRRRLEELGYLRKGRYRV